MRTIGIILSLLLTLTGHAQFGPQRGRNFTTNSDPLSTDFMIISRSGDTNYNLAIGELRSVVQITNKSQFPASYTYTDWEISKILLTTNSTLSGIDQGGLRVATCYRYPATIGVYYAGYKNKIVGGSGNNEGNIVAYYGASWSSLNKYGIVVARGASGAWDSGNIGGAHIFNFGGATNYLYYFAGVSTSFENGVQQIGVAYTTDGTNFTKYSGNPILGVGSSGNWDSSAIQGSVHVEKYQDTYYMFYCGVLGGQTRIGLAFSSSPLGPWNKFAGNPVVDPGSSVVEPNVFKLENDKGWAMICRGTFATSTNITNWVVQPQPINFIDPGFGAGHPSFPGVILSPFLFDDGGISMLVDDTKSVYLARPVNVNGLKSGTNSATSAAVIDFSKPYSAASINAAITLLDPAGVSLYGTNVQWATRFYTNTAGPSQKLMSFPAWWIGNTTANYITNQSVVSVVVYPGIGTNVVIRHLK